MSVTGNKGIGVPIVLLHDSEGFFVTVETKNDELYRGILNESEDNWNLHLRNVSYTDAEGRTSRLEAVFLRGSQVRFVVLPELLASAPIFRRVERFKTSKGRYVPVGSGTEKFTARRPHHGS